MKNIECDKNPNDFVKVFCTGAEAEIIIHENSTRSAVILSPPKIRKLRKQLKRALVEIEGEGKKEQDEEYNPGDRVYLIEGNDEGTPWVTSPSVEDIDMNIPVKLMNKDCKGRWELEFTNTNGYTDVGFASEKSFGRRA